MRLKADGFSVRFNNARTNNYSGISPDDAQKTGGSTITGRGGTGNDA